MSAHPPAVAGCDPLLPARIASLTGTTAVTAAAGVTASVLDQRGGQPGVFAAVGAVRAASEALAAALRLEEGAEARDADLESEAVAAAQALADAVLDAGQALERLPLPPEQRAGLAGALGAALRAWQDPFAADATGDRELAGLRAVVDSAPEGAGPAVEAVGPAVDRMVAAGRNRDAAAGRRQAAIRARVQAEERWQAAARALADAAGPGPWWEVGRPLVTVAEAQRPAVEAMEDDWFC
jgi:hypothetical protein